MSDIIDSTLNNMDMRAIIDNYTPSEAALNHINFVKFITQDKPEKNTTPITHMLMHDNYAGNDSWVLELLHRGAGKTTDKRFTVYDVATNGSLGHVEDITYMIYISDTADNGVKKFMMALHGLYQESRQLQEIFPKAIFNQQNVELHRVPDKEGNTKVIRIDGFGIGGAVRGTNFRGQRPQIAFIDDVFSDKTAKSDISSKAIDDFIMNAVYGAMDTKHKIIWSGTPFRSGDPLYSTIETGKFKTLIVPACQKFPCKRDDFVSLWKDRITYDYIKGMYDTFEAKGNKKGFYQEFMLRVASDEDKLLDDNDYVWNYKADIMKRQDAYNFYITTDFAVSDKEGADYSVISVWALNYDNHWFLVDGICKNQSMDKNINDLFRLCSLYRPLSVGIEVSGQQGGFIPWIKKEMGVRNIYFTLASDNNSGRDGIRPNNNKFLRFQTVLPWFKLNKIHFCEELRDTTLMIELLEELNFATISGFNSRHDDVIDTVSMLSVLTTYTPSSELDMDMANNKLEKNESNSFIFDRYKQSYNGGYSRYT